jgi:hypothetical protein
MFLSWWWRQDVSPKCLFQAQTLYGFTHPDGYKFRSHFHENLKSDLKHAHLRKRSGSMLTVDLMTRYKSDTISECADPSFCILNLYVICLSETK